MSGARDKAVIGAGLNAGLAYLTGGASLAKGGGLPSLSLSEKTNVTSGNRQENAQGSFNYTGPVISLPSVDQSAPFWATRDTGAPFFRAGAAALGDAPGARRAPWWAIGLGLAAAAGLAFYLARR